MTYYKRLKKPITQKDVDRFWTRVDIGKPNECWEWKLAITKNPYYIQSTENTMKLINNDGHKAHIYYSGLYYVASDNGSETLIFPSNKEGTIAEYREVGGAIDTTLAEVIGNFGSFLYKFKRT